MAPYGNPQNIKNRFCNFCLILLHILAKNQLPSSISWGVDVYFYCPPLMLTVNLLQSVRPSFYIGSLKGPMNSLQSVRLSVHLNFFEWIFLLLLPWRVHNFFNERKKYDLYIYMYLMMKVLFTAFQFQFYS